MEFLQTWINPLYAVILWILVFILIKPPRIKELLPVGIIAGIILFVVEYVLISLGLMQFNKGWILVAGVPLFNPIWGIAAGILVMQYMKQDFSKKIPMILFFTIIVEIAVYVAIEVGNMSLLGRYNLFYDFLVNFVVIVVLTHLAEGLYGQRIYRKDLTRI
ncbi:hypothetical protein [Desulforamulus aeronauticus]|uniref:Uncharacterized protein n=1 Tax=Desulforamulus aeronauticus DSM 10349 TaxID=1121421 RepID=A0A1M6RYE4_9FIRM|nr:hypothetical protein [Desulforamulus aeronauticus]SHK37514.1 hypothetical protein SAMN02745123_01626 [Desulforamulus aeronauticus DSM 10349]